MDKLKKGDGGIQLFSGRIFNPLNPTLDSFTVLDIAQGMTEQSRWGGHLSQPYKVVQHCIIGTRWFLKRKMINEARWYHMHENEEGLGLGDMPSPIKYLDEMSPYRVIGKHVQQAGFHKVGLFGQIPKAVKELDDRMKCAEAKVLCRNVPDWALEVDTSDIIIKPYKNPYYGKKVWLELFVELFPDVAVTA